MPLEVRYKPYSHFENILLVKSRKKHFMDNWLDPSRKLQKQVFCDYRY
jgi:hypothetical protein